MMMLTTAALSDKARSISLLLLALAVSDWIDLLMMA